MRLTKETYQIFSQQKQKHFLLKGRAFQETYFPALIRLRAIPEQALEDNIANSYRWMEEQGRASEVLAVRLACARLCFGSYFMDAPRLSELAIRVRQQITEEITDKDTIRDYLAEHRDAWEIDHFKRNINSLWELATSHEVFDTEERRKRHAISTLLKTESPRSEDIQTHLYQALNQPLIDKYPVISEGAGQIRLLMFMAQFYDGIACFNDPLRPLWYGILDSGNEQQISQRLQKAFWG